MILIVDDSPDTCRALQLILECEGYRAQCVESGLAALELAPKLMPHLVILDAEMPDLSGIDVLMLLRGMPDTKNIPVLFYSAYDDFQMIARARQLGAADWVALKPQTNFIEI